MILQSSLEIKATDQVILQDENDEIVLVYLNVEFRFRRSIEAQAFLTLQEQKLYRIVLGSRETSLDLFIFLF